MKNEIENTAKRNEASRMSKAKAKAEKLGMTLEAYLEHIKPMSEIERKARRAEQSRLCRDRKKQTKEVEINLQARLNAISMTNLMKANAAKRKKIEERKNLRTA